VGHYDLDLTAAGFKLYRRATITVDVNIASATFGRVVSAAAPRLVQIALKVVF
jgi:hypothetical protein